MYSHSALALLLLLLLSATLWTECLAWGCGVYLVSTQCVPQCVEPPLESLMRQYPTMDNIFALQFRAKVSILIVL